METIYQRVADLDVHKEMIVVGVRLTEAGKVREQVRTFGSMTDDLLALSDWLRHLQVTQAHLEEQLARFNLRLKEALRPFEDEATFERLDAIPGVNRDTIENVVAEIGSTMEPFPTAGHLASWAGVCPGNEASAGKRQRSRTTKGNVWLRRALGQAAWAASRKKDSYFQAQHRRLAGRRGRKRAAMAVGHSLLVLMYHGLKNPTLHEDEWGGDYFDRLNPTRLCRHLVKRLESLGYEVTLSRPTAYARQRPPIDQPNARPFPVRPD